MTPPETRYAKSGDVHIAYQVTGTGPFDLVWVPGFISNVELQWDFPEAPRFISRLASFCRVIRFDKRGTGLSDRVVGVPTLEQRMDDVRAVMDAVGTQQAALFGMSEGGPMSILFAATYPERTRALVLYGAFAHSPMWVSAPPEEFEARLSMLERAWGTGASVRRQAPSKASDEAFVRTFARFERLSASPSAASAIMRLNLDIDVRGLLGAIRVPTLVLHRTGDMVVPIQAGRYIGEHVPGAKFVELPGIDHMPSVGHADRLIDEMEEFLTGSRTEIEADRVLATVLFTDIVESTKRAAELGDRNWQALLNRHHESVRQQLARFRGREIKSLGDGFLATFDGPARAVRCASAIAETVQPMGLNVRSGLHTGEIELHRDDIGGIAVHIAARVAATAKAGETLVSSTVRDLVAGSGIHFEDRGRHALRGLADEVQLYTVLDS